MIPLTIPDLEQIDGYEHLRVISIAGDLVHLTAHGSKHFVSAAAGLVMDRPLRATVDGVSGTLNRLREVTAMNDSGMLHVKVRFLEDAVATVAGQRHGIVEARRRGAEIGSIQVIDASTPDLDFAAVLAEARAMAESGWIELIDLSDHRLAFRRVK